MLADVLRMASTLDIRRKRHLPLPGEVLVGEGDRVNPEDVIAQASLPKEIVMLDIAQGLGVSQDEAHSCIVRASGETLTEGDIIAQRDKPLYRLVRAPVDGRLVDIADGQVVIAVGERVIQVKAGMIGEILEILPEYGAAIYTHGSLLQGVWGNGKMGMGTLHWMESPKSEPIVDSALTDVENGAVVSGGLCCQASLFEKALEKEISGLILNAMAPELIPEAMALPFPVIVLSGFGTLPLNSSLADLFQSQSGKVACVNATSMDEIKGQRPEVIIPIEGKLTGEKLGYKSEISTGRRVRIISGAFAGQAGEIQDCPEAPLRFESGLKVPAAVINLADGKSVTVPQSNLVILE